MIGRLRGRVIGRVDEMLTIDVGGVGYEVAVTRTAERAFAAAIAENAELTVFVHTHVKEDALTLFGFSSLEERDAFRLLLGVSNVGPRTALALLSGLTVAELADAVAHKDLARLSSVQGIGKKTAERLVFELADKLGAFAAARAIPPDAASTKAAPGARADLLSALANLGYKPAQAERAAAMVEPMLTQKAPFESVLREALKALSR
jgi:Holliday junction DNA helicase RuvA